MIKLLLALATAIVLCAVVPAKGQSATTENLYRKYPGSMTLFFYQNTLRMINQQEDAEFDELIEEIEKMRFLMIRKKDHNLGKDDISGLTTRYKSEAFEAIMTSRHEGKTFDVYVRENQGRTKAMLILVNDEDNLYILDILGRIALDKVTKFYNTLDESTDISGKIRAFTSGGEDEGESVNDNNDGSEKR